MLFGFFGGVVGVILLEIYGLSQVLEPIREPIMRIFGITSSF